MSSVPIPDNGLMLVPKMTQEFAVGLIALVMGTLVGWTIGANLWLGHEWTSSQTIYRLASQYPTFSFAIGALIFSVFRDACPDIDWRVLYLVVAAAYALGHSLFPLK